MLSSPWWERLWTLQEHIEAGNCVAYLGRRKIPFTLLRLVCYLLYDSEQRWIPSNISKHHSRLSIETTHTSLRLLLGEDPMDPNITDKFLYHLDQLGRRLLVAAFWLDTGRPIDRIYGLYAILAPCFGYQLPDVDYNKTAEEVFEDTTWVWMGTRLDLSILKLAGRPDSLDQLRVPSWVPAWHQTHPNFDPSTEPLSDQLLRRLSLDITESPLAWAYSRETDWYKAARTEVREIGPVVSRVTPGELRIHRARYVGSVIQSFWERDSEITPDRNIRGLWQVTWCWFVHCMTSPDDREAMISELCRSVYVPGVLKSRDCSFVTTEEQFEDFRTWFNFTLYLIDRRLLIPGRYGHTIDDEIDPASLMSADRFLGALLRSDEEAALSMIKTCVSGDEVHWGDLVLLDKRINRVSVLLLMTTRDHNLRVFDNGKMLGVSNYWSRKGDEAFVFPGSDTPFLLRREPEGEAYRLVCPVSVDRLRVVGYQKWRAEGEDLRDVLLV